MDKKTKVKIKNIEENVELQEIDCLSRGVDVVYLELEKAINFFENFFNHIITEVVVADSEKNAKAAFKGMVPLVENDIIFVYDGKHLVSGLKVDDVKKSLQFSEID